MIQNCEKGPVSHAKRQPDTPEKPIKKGFYTGTGVFQSQKKRNQTNKRKPPKIKFRKRNGIQYGGNKNIKNIHG